MMLDIVMRAWLERIRDRLEARTLRPGLRRAAAIAERRAWSHPMAGEIGPERSLISLAKDLRALADRK